MNHTKQDILDALLVSAQIVQRQCKFAQVCIENNPSHGSFDVTVYINQSDGLQYHFDKLMDTDELDETFGAMEDIARETEIALRGL